MVTDAAQQAWQDLMYLRRLRRLAATGDQASINWKAERIEEMGYGTLFLPDHFGTQWDPMTALAGLAAATERIKIGSLVYDVDYRHPVIFAKAAATLQVLSRGRHEFGIGAGWMETDYVEAGLPYDRPGIRISRLEEALEIITSMWSNERTSFEGKYYSTNEIAQATESRSGWVQRALVPFLGTNPDM